MASKPVPNDPNLAPSSLHSSERFSSLLCRHVPCEKAETSVPRLSLVNLCNPSFSLAALNTSPVSGPELQNAPLKRTTYKQMPREMLRGGFVQTQVRPRRTGGEWAGRNNWHCLDSSHQHHVSLYPRPRPYVTSDW